MAVSPWSTVNVEMRDALACSVAAVLPPVGQLDLVMGPWVKRLSGGIWQHTRTHMHTHTHTHTHTRTHTRTHVRTHTPRTHTAQHSTPLEYEVGGMSADV